jgi:hypothetical protein
MRVLAQRQTQNFAAVHGEFFLSNLRLSNIIRINVGGFRPLFTGKFRRKVTKQR